MKTKVQLGSAGLSAWVWPYARACFHDGDGATLGYPKYASEAPFKNRGAVPSTTAVCARTFTRVQSRTTAIQNTLARRRSKVRRDAEERAPYVRVSMHAAGKTLLFVFVKVW